MSLRVPILITVSYETSWPELLLTDNRDPRVAEEGYLYQGNILACAAIRHLASAVLKLEQSIRETLHLRPQAVFTLSLPDLNGVQVTPMEVIKSLVMNLMSDDEEEGGGEGGGQGGGHAKGDDGRMGARRASILGSGLSTLRVKYDVVDVVRCANYVARVRIYPRRTRGGGGGGGAQPQPQVVDFPVEVNVDATQIVQMVEVTVQSFFSSSGAAGVGDLGAPTGDWDGEEDGEDGDGEGEIIRLFYEGRELYYECGMLVGERMFKLVEGKMLVCLEARWARRR